MNTTAKSIKELAENIKKYNEAYRKGAPIVPDIFYDQEVSQLKELDPDNEWFKHIEPAPVANGRKVKLPIPMKSLYKVKSTEELMKWITNLALNDSHRLVITPKFDGLSLLHNELTDMTYSRGGAENEGQDCTAHYLHAQFPKVKSNLLYTYGEFVFSIKSWNEHFYGQVSPETGDKYKSPRNTAAGLLNRDMPSDLLMHIDFFRYGADATSMKHFERYSHFYSYVCDTFNQSKLYHVAYTSEITEELLHNLFNLWKKEYYIDGLVIYIDDLKLWEVIGRHETTGNPNYAIAYKNPNFTEIYETKVLDVNWAISKTGALKPVVKTDVVDTGDCEMESPTGYNARYIKENHIAPGAVIKVTRSGGVIPKILETITPATSEAEDKMWGKLIGCPHCHAPLAWNETGVELCCTNEGCSGRRLSKIVFFYTIIAAENMGVETITKMYDAGFNTLNKMLDITFDELLNIEGFGVETANIVLQNHAKIRKGLEVTVAMHASDCFTGIGQVKAKQILEKMSDEDMFAFVNGSFYIPEYDVIRNAPWYRNANKTMQSFYNGINPFYRFIAENKLSILPLAEKPKTTSDKYVGFKVCFTGIRDKMLEEQIMAGGGEIASGVSKKTTHLIVADPDSLSGKAKKAKELNIPILTIEEFKAL